MFQIKIKNENTENEYYVFGEQELHIIGKATLPVVAVPNFFDLSIISGNNTNITSPISIDITVQGKKTKEEKEEEYMYGSSHSNKPQIIYKNSGQSINVSSNLTFLYTNNCPVIVTKNGIENYEEINLNSDIISLTLEEYETLYELYLQTLKENPTMDYQNRQTIKQDVDKAKNLIKNRA